MRFYHNSIALFLGLWFCSWCSYAQDITLAEQFNGQYDFLSIGASHNSETSIINPNCVTEDYAEAMLNLPQGVSIVKAYLYWAEPFSNNNSTINLNDQQIAAEENFFFDFAFFNIELYGYKSDITDFINANGDNVYAVSDVDLEAFYEPTQTGGTLNCENDIPFFGWSILIIYEDPTLPYSQINLYDGLDFCWFYDSDIAIDFDNLNVVDNADSKLEFLSYTGGVDATNPIADLYINDLVVDAPPLNPAGSIINSSNTYTGDDEFWNMDLDVFALDNYINSGDTSLNFSMSTLGGSNSALVQRFVTKVRSELPNTQALFTAISGDAICDNRTLDLTWTLQNDNATGAIAPGLPVSIYYLDENSQEVLIDNVTNADEIPIGGSQSYTTTLNIPPALGLNFELLIRANDAGDGQAVIDETDYTDNSDTINLTLVESPDALSVQDLAQCANLSVSFFNLNNAVTDSPEPEDELSFHLSLADANTDDNAIATPENYNPQNLTETIYLRRFDGNCFATSEFEIESLVPPQISDPATFAECDFSDAQDGFASFDLSSKIDEIINNSPDYAVEFFTTQAEAEDLNIDTGLSSPYTNDNAFSQTLFVRVTDINNDCVSFTSLELQVDLLPEIATSEDLPSLELCDEGNGQADFDLTQNSSDILNGLTATEHEIEFYSSETEADNDQNPITNPDNFISAGQTIFVRVTDIETGCYALTSFDLLVLPLPDLNPPNTIRICDLDDDGQASFFLPVVENELINAPENYNFSYYESQTDADNDQNPISNPDNFINTQSPIQTIYVLVTDTETGCQSTTNFEIEVLPVNFIPFALTDFEVCADTTDGIGIGLDLTSQEAFIFGETDNSDDYLVTYHLSQSDAAEGE
uniref:hypothetical protein n=1 Tax=Psychroflexus aestuariivivens TaxID=1795040 RepID=UPI003742D67A